nr:acyltransferase [Ramlibacter algicola]
MRGLCALMVAGYHLLYWLGLAQLPTFGTYGVYLFFVLSGASLAYSYDPAKLLRAGAMARFLATRWLRLAPLYVLLCAVFIGMLWAVQGTLVDRLPQRLLLNVTFAFGANDPAIWALLVGGWSLGIEAVLYLAFPVLAWLAAAPRWRRIAFAVLVALQAWWIQRTLGAHGWDAGNVAYHQVPAFAAYFFAGCMAGAQRRARGADWPWWVGAATWAALVALLLALIPVNPGDELLGVRGFVLAAACMATVWVSGRIVVPLRLRKLAAVAGDITYGTYLLHPILLFGLFWFVVPVEGLSTLQRWCVLAAVGAASVALAWASERWFERPVRRWGRARLAARPLPRQSEAASMSS